MTAAVPSPEPSTPLPPANADDWTREAMRIHRRYLVEMVEGYNFCPWAARSRTGDHLRFAALLEEDDARIEPALATLAAWIPDEGLEVAFILFPRLSIGRVAFDRFVSRIREAHTASLPLGEAPFAMVAFHPAAAPDLEDAELLVPYLRRSPDPCIQVVRVAVLDKVRGDAPEGTQFADEAFFDRMASGAPEPSLRERVMRANLETVRKAGVADIDATFARIVADRDATYRALSAR